ncbi:MAG: hypothetical protein FD174_2863 [Geobacteraceae bacterium]|nr:MAG: hypothetical protein FD174_2863 [Geobacteraceae bacterium]
MLEAILAVVVCVGLIYGAVVTYKLFRDAAWGELTPAERVNLFMYGIFFQLPAALGYLFRKRR